MSAHETTIECPHCLHWSVDVAITAAEPEVRYYPDGSGYPGAPAEVEVLAQSCDCELDHERVRETALQDADDREEYERDLAAEAAMEARWIEDHYGA
jgi:hypothetical protein